MRRAGAEVSANTSGVAARCRCTRPLGRRRKTVPVELTERALHDVIAVTGEWDRDRAQAAESALNWMG